jgi:hypothetical protein
MVQYMRRAEQIKEALEGKKKKKPKVEISAEAAPYVDAAIKAAEEATDEDESGRYAQAIPKYELCIANFSSAIKSNQYSI